MGLYCRVFQSEWGAHENPADSQVEAKATLLEKCVTTTAQLLSKSGTGPEKSGKKIALVSLHNKSVSVYK